MDTMSIRRNSRSGRPNSSSNTHSTTRSKGMLFPVVLQGHLVRAARPTQQDPRLLRVIPLLRPHRLRELLQHLALLSWNVRSVSIRYMLRCTVVPREQELRIASILTCIRAMYYHRPPVPDGTIRIDRLFFRMCSSNVSNTTGIGGCRGLGYRLNMVRTFCVFNEYCLPVSRDVSYPVRSLSHKCLAAAPQSLSPPWDRHWTCAG